MAKTVVMAVSKKLARKIQNEKDFLQEKERRKRKTKKKKRVTLADACDSLLERLL